MDRPDSTVPHSTNGSGAALARTISKFHALRCDNGETMWLCHAAARAASPFLDGSVQFTFADEACRPRGSTMALTMTKEEREAFLADVHVAVISVAEDGHGPLVVPIWYSYEPGGEVRIITGRTSRKGQLLERAGRLSLCVQTETLPYKYVSVEGPIVAVEAADLERDRRPLARRYLGTELGDSYIESTRDVVGNVLVRMRPERWLTVDYSKQYQSR